MNIDEIRAIKRLAIDTAKLELLTSREKNIEQHGIAKASGILSFAAIVLRMEFEYRVKLQNSLSNPKKERDEIAELIKFLREENDRMKTPSIPNSL